MGDNIQIIEIILLAMIAAFIALRLRSVLGQRGPDETPKGPKGSANVSGDKRAEPGKAAGFGRPKAGQPQPLASIPGPYQAAIRKIFGPLGQAGFNKFLEGAKTAYEMTLKGFWSGNMGEMEPYIDEEVLNGFRAAIEEREKKGHKVENKLVEILDTRLEEAEVEGSTAEITLRFESEIVAVLRDKAGKLLEGDTSDTVKVTDIWTFAKNLKSRDPNWMLVATESG